MYPVVLNALLPILGMLISSNIASAFGVNCVPEFIMISAIGTAVMAMPMPSSTLAFLIVAACGDLLMSGPPGITAFVAVILYLFIRMMTLRYQPQRLLAIAFFAAFATFAFHAALAGIYLIYYKDVPFFSIWLHNDWIAALETAVLAPFMVWITNALSGLFEKRKKTGLS